MVLAISAPTAALKDDMKIWQNSDGDFHKHLRIKAPTLPLSVPVEGMTPSTLTEIQSRTVSVRMF